MNRENLRRLLLAVLAVLGWFAIISQFYLSLLNTQRPAFETIVNFFSYFTIQINLLVAVTVTILFMKGMNAPGFLAKERTLAATAAYITIVGITYNLLLRSVWNPQGLQKITDELLHTAIPLLFVVFWISFAPKKSLKSKEVMPLMIYPMVYAVYTLIHGLMSGWYPYPFIDPNNVGWTSVGINSVLVLIAFFVVSLLFLSSGKKR